MAPMQDLALLAALIQVVSAQSSSSYEKPSGPSDESLANNLLMALAAFVGMVFIYRVVLYSMQYVRHLTSLNSGTQRYFAVPSSTWASAKKHILYAPLLRNRHNAELKLSRAVNMGTLPTRFQTLFMVAIIATNVTLCVYNLPWSGEEMSVLSALLKRTGTLATVNLIPMMILVGRNNPLIPLLNTSFDSFNMMHRAFARILTLEALAHTLCWIIMKVQKSGWGVVTEAFRTESMIYTGLIGTVLLLAIITLAFSPIRHAFYETFLHIHIVLAVVVFVFIYLHVAGFPQQNYLFGAIGCWAFDRAYRMVTLIYHNVGRGGTKAVIESLPGDAMRITFHMARPWTFRPGQWFYVTIPSVGLWTSHPFSIAWSDDEGSISSSLSNMSDEKGLVMTRQDMQAINSTTFSAVVRRRTGFTNTLWEKAEKAGAFDGATLTLGAFVNGPYGLNRSMSSYGTVMLFAGGVGITHQVPYVRELVRGYGEGTVAARKVILVWIIQSPEHLEWIRPWMTSILGMDKRREVLSIKLFITRPRSAKEVHSPSSTVQMFPGRPHIETLIGKECESQVGAMGVSVCGTGELQDDVRRVVRSRSQWNNIDFVEESFTW